jgi:hypothetical protein
MHLTHASPARPHSGCSVLHMFMHCMSAMHKILHKSASVCHADVLDQLLTLQVGMLLLCVTQMVWWNGDASIRSTVRYWWIPGLHRQYAC